MIVSFFKASSQKNAIKNIVENFGNILIKNRNFTFTHVT